MPYLAPSYLPSAWTNQQASLSRGTAHSEPPDELERFFEEFLREPNFALSTPLLGSTDKDIHFSLLTSLDLLAATEQMSFVRHEQYGAAQAPSSLARSEVMNGPVTLATTCPEEANARHLMATSIQVGILAQISPGPL
jgi:hypothetical protein